MSGFHRLGIALALVGLAGVSAGAGSTRPSAGVSSTAWLSYVRLGDVYVLDPARRVTIRLTRGRAAQAKWGPLAVGDLALSPDETRVAFTGSTPRGAAIFVRSIAGTG